MRRRLLAVAIALAFVGGGPAADATEPEALPSSIAAIGDSITQAVDVCCWYGDHPANSWSTGGSGSDGISSHYERIRAVRSVVAYNDSVSGAKMSDAPGQATKAVSQGARYVTILMGGNDLCTSSTSTMTSVETYRAQFRQTLQTLTTGLPRARIFVGSVPDVYRLWELFHTDVIAQAVWAAAEICQSLLALDGTAADREAVRQRNIAFNTVLAQECAAYANCRFDQNAVFNYRFTAGNVSKLDYFHPSLSGQAALANVTWAASWWPGR